MRNNTQETGDAEISEEDLLNEEIYEDTKIDYEIKDLLKNRRYGQIIPSDTLAHLEFFYNTLILGHETENPFKNPKEYPALNYQEDA